VLRVYISEYSSSEEEEESARVFLTSFFPDFYTQEEEKVYSPIYRHIIIVPDFLLEE
jgi:hypothetical protein